MTLNNRGATYAKMGKRKKALDDYNLSLQLCEHPHTLHNRGVTYMRLQKYEEALSDFNRALEIKANDADTMYFLSTLFSLWRKTDEALIYLEKAFELNKKYQEMAKKDKDFDNIRDDPHFKKLIGED
jgi:tetratricopeptide (TPR) repeat protein